MRTCHFFCKKGKAEKKKAFIQLCKCENNKDDIILAKTEIDLTKHLTDEWKSIDLDIPFEKKWAD